MTNKCQSPTSCHRITVQVWSTRRHELTSQHMFVAIGKIDCSVNLSMEDSSFRSFGARCAGLFPLTHVINESHTDIQVHTVWRSVGFACPTQNGAIEPLFSRSWANAEDAHRSEYVSRALTADAVESPFGHVWRVGSEMPCCLLWDHELFFLCVRVRAEGVLFVWWSSN